MSNAPSPQAPVLWFDGQSSRAWPAMLSAVGEDLIIAPQGAVPLRVARAQLEWLGGVEAPRPILRTPGGAQIVLPARNAALDAGLHPARHSALRRFLAATPALVVALLFWVALVVFLVGWALPPAADWVAGHLPPTVERRLGMEALRALDSAYLATSELSEVERQRIAARVRELGRAAGLADLRIEFRQGKRMGPNAVAVPGGVVILTDELIALLGESTQLDAVVAHELGHLVARHGVRNYLRDAGMGALFLVVLPDPTMAEKVAEHFAKKVLMAGHSREAEREADAFAGQILLKAGRSSRDLAEALQKIAAATGAEGRAAGFLSSHPSIEERVGAAAPKQP